MCDGPTGNRCAIHKLICFCLFVSVCCYLWDCFFVVGVVVVFCFLLMFVCFLWGVLGFF